MEGSQNIENGTIRKRKADDSEVDSEKSKPRKFAAVLSMLKARRHITSSSNTHPERVQSIDMQASTQSYNLKEALLIYYYFHEQQHEHHSLQRMVDVPEDPKDAEVITDDVSDLYDDVSDASADEDGDVLGVDASQSPRWFCYYNGASCACMVSDHLCDLTTPSSSLLHVDDDCLILRVLNLKFHKRHRYLICSCSGGSFLALRELKDHLKKKHSGDIRDGNTRSMEDFPMVVDHISTSFDIPISQDSREFSKEDFDGPIAGINDPLSYLRCPWPSCKSFGVSFHVLRSHHLQAHGTSLSSSQYDTPCCWTQFPFATKGSHAARVEVDISRVVPLVAAPKSTTQPEPSIRPYITPHGVTAPTSLWLDHVQWTAWRDEQLRNNYTVSSLRAMIALPAAERVSMQPMLRPLTIDRFLHVVGGKIRIRATKMLKDANKWLGNSELRTAITAGYDYISFTQQYSHYCPEHGHTTAKSKTVLTRLMHGLSNKCVHLCFDHVPLRTYQALHLSFRGVTDRTKLSVLFGHLHLKIWHMKHPAINKMLL